MNLIEIYITKIINESRVQTEKFGELVHVTYEYDAYGQKGVKCNYFMLDEWEEIKKKGYYLG